MKPNPDKQSGRFDGEDVLLQLQYSGTMETIRIRQQVKRDCLCHPTKERYYFHVRTVTLKHHSCRGAPRFTRLRLVVCRDCQVSFSTVCHECCRFQRLTPSVVTSCCRDVTARGGQGYALRELKDDFMKKYKVLHPNADDLESLVAYLSTMLGASSRDWQIGTSKVRGHHTSYANMGCEIAAVEEALMFSFG